MHTAIATAGTAFLVLMGSSSFQSVWQQAVKLRELEMVQADDQAAIAKEYSGLRPRPFARRGSFFLVENIFPSKQSHLDTAILGRLFGSFR
jgi:hypothetical protein